MMTICGFYKLVKETFEENTELTDEIKCNHLLCY